MLGLLLAFGLARAVAAVTAGEIDDFSASTEGWLRGSLATPGQGGVGDSYLRLTADGVGNTGRLVTFNQTQWAGNYLAANVTSISMLANNLGPTDLSLRVVFGDSAAPLNGGSWFASASPVLVPSGSGWVNVVFPIDCASLAQTTGTKTCAQLMAGVVTLRLLHAAALNDQGDLISAILGVDRISAPVPVPIYPID